MTTRRDFIAASIAASLLPFSAGNAFAQALNKGRPSRFVVGFEPGGGTDVIARLVAEAIRPAFPDGLLVDNKPGASSRIAVNFVKNAAPDGFTMLVTPDFSLTVYPHSFPNLDYDPLTDLIAVAPVAQAGLALCVGPMVPASVTNPVQFLDWCRQNPQLASFGSPGAGSSFHFAGILLATSHGTDLMHVGYKGGAPALRDVMGGQIAANICAIGEAKPHLQSGKLRIIGTFGTERDPFAPDAPTMVESGFKDVVAYAWVGVLVPAGTPPEVVTAIAAELNKATEGQALKDRLGDFAMRTLTMSPIEFRNMLEEDINRWGPVVRASGFTAG